MSILAVKRSLILPRGGSSASAYATNLVGYWRLNEASSDAIDYSGASRTLTDTNTVGSGTGKVSAAARDFEVSNAEYFTRADEAAFEAGSQSWSACGWVNPESTSASYRVLMSKFDISANRGWKLDLQSPNNQLHVDCRDGTNTKTLTHSATLSNGTWYFVAGGWDAAQLKCWASVNAGTREHGTVAVGMTIQDDTYAFRIGREVNGAAGTYMDGLMEQWGLWIGRVLTDDELAYIYNAGAGRVLF